MDTDAPIETDAADVAADDIPEIGASETSFTDHPSSADAAEANQGSQPDAADSDGVTGSGSGGAMGTGGVAGTGGASGTGSVCNGKTGVVVSTEISVSPTTTGYSQQLPTVAFDGSNYLLVWQEGPPPGTNWIIKATRVSLSAVLLDDPPIVVSSVAGDAPVAGFNGTDFVLAWEQAGGIYTTRVTPAGKVLDPAGIVIAQKGVAPGIACGTDTCLVAWVNQPSILATHIGVLGTVLDSPSITVHKTPVGGGEVGSPQVDFDGIDYFLVWVNESFQSVTMINNGWDGTRGRWSNFNTPGIRRTPVVGFQRNQSPRRVAGLLDGPRAALWCPPQHRWRDHRSKWVSALSIGHEPNIPGSRLRRAPIRLRLGRHPRS